MSAGRFDGGREESRRSGASAKWNRWTERQSINAVTEPPGGRSGSQGPNQPPDGTGHRQGGRVMKAGSDEPPDKPSRPQPDPQGDGKASDDKPGTGDRPKSCGCNAGVLGADSNVGPICVVGGLRGASSKHHWPASVRLGILLSNFCCSGHDPKLVDVKSDIIYSQTVGLERPSHST